jgi:hypothetical protein
MQCRLTSCNTAIYAAVIIEQALQLGATLPLSAFVKGQCLVCNNRHSDASVWFAKAFDDNDALIAQQAAT